MTNLFKRIGHSFSANVFGQVVNVVTQIICLPIFLNYWGVNLYGNWILLTSIPAYFTLCDFGFSFSASALMTMQVGAGDKKMALVTFQSTWLLINISCIFCLLIAVIALYLPLSTWLEIRYISNNDAQVIVAAMIISMIFQLQISLLYAGFRCDGNNAIGLWLSNFIQLIMLSAIIVILYLGYSPVELSIGYVIVRAIGYFMALYMLKIKSNWLKLGFKLSTKKNLAEMVRPSLAYMSYPACNAIKNQGLIMVVGYFLGPIVLVSFNTMRTIINIVQQLVGMVNSTFAPEFSVAYGSGQKKLLKNLYYVACKITVWASFFALIILSFFGNNIISAWSHGGASIEPVFFNIMLIVALISGFWSTSSMVISAANRHGKMAIFYLIASICAMMTSIALVPHFNLGGIAISLLLSEICVALYVLKNSLIMIDSSAKNFFEYLLRPTFTINN